MTHEQIIKALQIIMFDPIFSLKGDSLEGLTWLDERTKPTNEEIIVEIANLEA